MQDTPPPRSTALETLVDKRSTILSRSGNNRRKEISGETVVPGGLGDDVFVSVALPVVICFIAYDSTTLRTHEMI